MTVRFVLHMDYDSDFEDKFLATEYGTIHYKRHKGAAASSLVLLHGMASSTLTWKRLVGELPGHLDICMIDLLGHGKSDAPDIDYTVHIQTGIVKEVLAREEISTPFIMGHSYGGWVSAIFAIENPVNGLVLEDSGGLKAFYDEIKGDKDREKYKKMMLAKAVELGANRHVMERILDDQFREGELDGKSLGRIEAPSLVIWGREDSVINVKYATVFNQIMRSSKLEIIDNARHTPHYTNAQDVSRILLEFINGHPSDKQCI